MKYIGNMNRKAYSIAVNGIGGEKKDGVESVCFWKNALPL